MSIQPQEFESLVRTNLKRRRVELGLSQTDVAKRMGVAPGYICNLERGIGMPNTKTLPPLAKALETTPAKLLSTDAFPAPKPSESAPAA